MMIGIDIINPFEMAWITLLLFSQEAAGETIFSIRSVNPFMLHPPFNDNANNTIKPYFMSRSNDL